MDIDCRAFHFPLATDGIKAESDKDLTYSQYYAWLDAATEVRDRFLKGEITEAEALAIIIVP